MNEFDFAKKTIYFPTLKKLKETTDGKEVISNEFAFLFTRIANLSGIKEAISDINKSDIKELLLTHHSGLSIEEIDYAFKLDRYSGEPTPHYGLFNAEFVAKVLKKYKIWLNEKRTTYNLPISLPQETQTSKPNPETRLKLIEIVFLDLKQKKYSDDAWILYAEMVDKGKIFVSDEEKKRMYINYYNEQKNALKTKVNKSNLFKAKIQIKEWEDLHAKKEFLPSIVHKCQSVLVSEYLLEFTSDFERFKNECL